MTPGVSFVVPIYNGRRHLRRVLGAIVREARQYPSEIILVDDGSTDGSVRVVRGVIGEIGMIPGLEMRLIRGPGCGAAAAMNAGIRESRYPFIAQIDQDVVIEPGWTKALLERLQDPSVAAAQGRYVVGTHAGSWARVAARDLDQRYATLGQWTDQVCTGNTIYRASALHQAGLFDERLGYGYDNDLSYRLAALGYQLAFAKTATAVHCWRDTAGGYARHQYGVGYGRLDVVRRHLRRAAGDAVSGTAMMLHAPLMLLALVLLPLSLAWPLAMPAAASIVAVLMGERLVAGIRAWQLTRDRITLFFPIVHLFRDVVWAAAIVAWISRRITRRVEAPGHSMPRRASAVTARVDAPSSLLVLIPVYNEAQSLPAVIDDLQQRGPRAKVLVIDDASTDQTRELLPSLDVAWLSLPQRLGVGGAVRAGVRYARRHGYTTVARIDGDGQHRAADLARLLAPVCAGEVDAVTGSRYLRGSPGATPRRITQRLLGLCLSALTGERVTDPTSGLWVFGARAIDVLLEHHPGGYPEPELRLVLARHGLRVRELPIRARPRRAGRTSLTPARTAIAFARTALAMLIAPLNGTGDRS